MSTDQGGHYIARRFNGPTEEFNHFAQDADFNRGRYKTIENTWAKATQAGKRVFVDIIPVYHSSSKRPDVLIVSTKIGGETRIAEFYNGPGGRRHGK